MCMYNVSMFELQSVKNGFNNIQDFLCKITWKTPKIKKFDMFIY